MSAKTLLVASETAALLVALAMAVQGACASEGTQDISPIRRLYNSINQELAGSKEASCTRFVTSPNDYEKNVWHRVDSSAEFEGKHFARAKVCFTKGKHLAKATFEVFSEAGDWADLREHYYYPNGRLAFFFKRQPTIQAYDTANDREIPGAPYVLERRLYFDPNGKTLRKLEKAFSEKGKTEFPASYVYPIEFEIYMTIEQLPFGKEMKSSW